MLKIFIHPNNIQEKKYIINVILYEMLGISYIIEYHQLPNYKIVINDRAIIFDDILWSQQKSENYININNIPTGIQYLKNQYSMKALPIIYGTNKWIQEDKNIYCGLDIFASSFFMLSRWEEYVNKKRDKYDRFPVEESLAYKFNFIHIPVVNGYIELLWNTLCHIGYTYKRKNRNYNIFPTVDLDHISSSTGLKRMLLKDFRYTGKCLRELKETIIKFPKYYESENYLYSLNTIMEKAEDKGQKIYFFILSGTCKRYDYNAAIEDKRINEVIKIIKRRGHYIGIHPGFDTYNNLNLWIDAKRRLIEVSGDEVKLSRQHYLRFSNPITWQIMERNKIESDSTLGYATNVGFRCGICHEYSVYDIIQRKRLMLKEYPLLIMDVALKDYLKLNIGEAIELIKNIKNQVKLYKGNFVFLWHNTSFNTPLWNSYKVVYEELWT